MNKHLAALISSASLAVLTVLAPVDSAHAASRPVARPDSGTVQVGAVVKVKVLANDKVARKPKAKVSLTRVPAGVSARVSGRDVVLTAVEPGTFTLRYRVVDVRGKRARSTVQVTATLTGPPGPTMPTGTVVSPPASVPFEETLLGRIEALPVAAEVSTGYDRNLYKHWVDADKDGCDTRREVLIAESTTPLAVADSTCEISGGAWYSYYDGATWTDPADVDIDHVVALSEAHASGAHAWGAARREAFANDLGDARSLVAVTDNVNQSKGDQDPAEWLPLLERCRYIAEWVAVKTRWTLSVDTVEKQALRETAAGCENVAVPVAVAS